MLMCCAKCTLYSLHSRFRCVRNQKYRLSPVRCLVRCNCYLSLNNMISSMKCCGLMNIYTNDFVFHFIIAFCVRFTSFHLSCLKCKTAQMDLISSDENKSSYGNNMLLCMSVIQIALGWWIETDNNSSRSRNTAMDKMNFSLHLKRIVSHRTVGRMLEFILAGINVRTEKTQLKL